jgi:hypothetical protein
MPGLADGLIHEIDAWTFACDLVQSIDGMKRLTPSSTW